MRMEIKLQHRGDIVERIGRDTTRYFLQASRELLVSDLKDTTPVKDGNLRNAWHVKNITDTQLVVENSTNYGIFPEKGTGLFGPNKKLIRPKTKKAMRARIDGNVVYFTTSKGQPAQHYVEKGANQFKAHIPNLLRTAIIKTRSGGK